LWSRPKPSWLSDLQNMFKNSRKHKFESNLKKWQKAQHIVVLNIFRYHIADFY